MSPATGKSTHLHLVSETTGHAHAPRFPPGSAVLVSAGFRITIAVAISAAIWGGVLLAML